MAAGARQGPHATDNLVQKLASQLFVALQDETGFFRFGGVDGVLEVLRALRAHNAAVFSEMT